MADDAPILIAGGGIGGLALALALARRRVASIVLERQPALGAEGAGIQLGPNGVRALRGLGLAEALKPWVGEPEAIEVFAGLGGRRLARLPLGGWIAARHGAPYWTVHRGDLHRALAEAASGHPLIEIRTGFEVAKLAEAAAQATTTDEAGRAVSGPVLVGADGLWSTVRHSLVPDATPRPAGVTATRTVIPAAAAGRLLTGCVGLWLGADAHVVHYPVRGGVELAVTVIAREDWQGRAWDAEADAEAAGAVSSRRCRGADARGGQAARLAQVGAQRTAPAVGMGTRPHRADRRRRPSHAALSGPGWSAGPGGRARPRRLPARRRGPARGALAVRGAAPGPPRPRAGRKPSPRPHLSPRGASLLDARRRSGAATGLPADGGPRLALRLAPARLMRKRRLAASPRRGLQFRSRPVPARPPCRSTRRRSSTGSSPRSSTPTPSAIPSSTRWGWAAAPTRPSRATSGSPTRRACRRCRPWRGSWPTQATGSRARNPPPTPARCCPARRISPCTGRFRRPAPWLAAAGSSTCSTRART